MYVMEVLEMGLFSMRGPVDERLSRRGIFHLCLVYVLWSTTYLAMRVGVRGASGFPPFSFLACCAHARGRPHPAGDSPRPGAAA